MGYKLLSRETLIVVMEDLSAKKHSIVPAFAFKKRKAFAELQTLRRRERDSNSWNPNQVRRFSKPVVSATHPSLQSEDTGLYLIVQNRRVWRFSGCKDIEKNDSLQIFRQKFSKF